MRKTEPRMLQLRRRKERRRGRRDEERDRRENGGGVRRINFSGRGQEKGVGPLLALQNKSQGINLFKRPVHIRGETRSPCKVRGRKRRRSSLLTKLR